jgi:hypothetical protein
VPTHTRPAIILASLETERPVASEESVFAAPADPVVLDALPPPLPLPVPVPVPLTLEALEVLVGPAPVADVVEFTPGSPV